MELFTEVLILIKILKTEITDVFIFQLCIFFIMESNIQQKKIIRVLIALVIILYCTYHIAFGIGQAFGYLTK